MFFNMSPTGEDGANFQCAGWVWYIVRVKNRDPDIFILFRFMFYFRIKVNFDPPFSPGFPAIPFNPLCTHIISSPKVGWIFVCQSNGSFMLECPDSLLFYLFTDFIRDHGWCVKSSLVYTAS